MAISDTAATCTGTVTVTWNVQGEGGVVGVFLTVDPSATGSLSLTSGGEEYGKPQRSGSLQVGFTLTAGTGQVDVTIQGSDFRIPTVTTNTVTCTPPA
jgi:hypothetical protein